MSRLLGHCRRWFSLRSSAHRDLVRQSVQTGTLMAAGDLLAQSVEGRRFYLPTSSRGTETDLALEETFSPLRVLRFFGLGCVMVGPALAVWFRLLERYVGRAAAASAAVAAPGKSGHARRLAPAVAQMAVDQLVFAPVFLAVFVTAITILRGDRWSAVRHRLHQDYGTILLNNWRLWPMVQLMNFYLVPLRYRVLLVQTVAIFWNTYLSYKLNSNSTSCDSKAQTDNSLTTPEMNPRHINFNRKD